MHRVPNARLGPIAGSSQQPANSELPGIAIDPNEFSGMREAEELIRDVDERNCEIEAAKVNRKLCSSSGWDSNCDDDEHR